MIAPRLFEKSAGSDSDTRAADVALTLRHSTAELREGAESVESAQLPALAIWRIGTLAWTLSQP